MIQGHTGPLGSSVLTSLHNLGVVFEEHVQGENYGVPASISSRLDFGNSLFTFMNNKDLNRLQVVQNSVALETQNTSVLAALYWS